jgi:hypothetical protein
MHKCGNEETQLVQELKSSSLQQCFFCSFIQRAQRERRFSMSPAAMYPLDIRCVALVYVR